MDMSLGHFEEQNKKKSMIATTILCTLFILALFIPFLVLPDPPPGQEGIMVNLGIPDVGEGDRNAPAPAPSEPSKPVEETPPPPVEPETTPEEVTPPPPPEKAEPTPKPRDKVVETEDPAAIALRKQKEREEAERKADERAKERARDAERKKQAEEAARKKAAEEAKRAKEAADARKAAEEKAALDAAKNKYSGAFGGDTGGGKGNTGTQGNQGDANGNPNSDILEGISVGKGRVGGGLSDRGVTGAPEVRDQSQKTGTVVVQVCVDADGSVTSAKFNLAGSTTQDPTLIQKAVANAKRWSFSKGQADKQCGTIKYEFKVK